MRAIFLYIFCFIITPFSHAFELHSKAAIITDRTENTIVYEKNADKKMPIASLTKLVSALVVLEKPNTLDRNITISKQDVDYLKKSSSRLPVGATINSTAALNISLMSSENRATSALARLTAKDLPRFANLMNEKVKSFSLYNTSFADPTGLSPRNVSTAREYEVILSHAGQNPLIRSFSSLEATAIKAKNKVLWYKNSNPLYHNFDDKIKLITSKTGYTKEAGRCIAYQIEINQRIFNIVLLGSNSKQQRATDMNNINNYLYSIYHG